jgi:rhodanese-related sulfurtransferase
MPSYRRKPIDLVVDVRSRLEFWLGHLEGATCIPVGKVAEAIPKREGVTRDTRILVYCASGARSAAAAGILKSLGYRHVTDGGGMATARPDYAP